MYKIIDDFLSPSYFKALQMHILGSEFNWQYVDNISVLKQSHKFGFYHVCVFDGQTVDYFYSNMLAGFFCQLLDNSWSGSQIYRARIDMVTNTGKDIIHDAHIDIHDKEHISAVFYLNEADGDTILYNETATHSNHIDNLKLTEKIRITPKPNRVVMFDGTLAHTGCSPTSCPRRVIINTNIL